jgi:hypothetical protein
MIEKQFVHVSVVPFPEKRCEGFVALLPSAILIKDTLIEREQSLLCEQDVTA